MKKFILLCVVAFPLIIVFTVGSFLFTANRVGEKSQRTFFEAVATGDPANVLNLLDPELHSQVDAPVLKQWMQAVNQNLGQYEGIGSLDFNTKLHLKPDAEVTESAATVLFQHGTARSEVVFVNDRITSFDVESDRLNGNWFQGPAETTLYRDRALNFYRAIAAEDATAARALMSEELRAEVSQELMEQMSAKINAHAGELKEIKIISDEYAETKEKGQRLTVMLRFDGQENSFDAKADFQFIGLQGVLIAFNLDKAS